MRTPTEIFRIRNSQLKVNQRVEFKLRLIDTYDSYTKLNKTTSQHFQLKYSPPHNAHLIVVQELTALQEIELHIEMKIYTDGKLNSISIMKVFIYVSQYSFYP